MICPACKSEFVEGVSVCSDCGIPLVDRLPDPGSENSEPVKTGQAEETDYVLVYRPINSQEVALIRMILEREGIPFFIKNEPLHRAVIFSIQGPGEIQLFVPEKYAVETAGLLRSELEHD
jgi:hypothetical protein